jgi:hypothetical protein
MKKAFLAGAGLVIFSLVAMGLDVPLGGLDNWQVDCAAAATPLTTDSGGTKHYTDTIYVGSSSATCVHIGGTGVTATTGLSVGTGCREGVGVSIDSRLATCFSSGGTVTVDVVGGKR